MPTEIELQRIKEANKELIRKMKEGENLTAFSSTNSFFPSRQIIKKDLEAIKTLYSVVDTDEEKK